MWVFLFVYFKKYTALSTSFDSLERKYDTETTYRNKERLRAQSEALKKKIIDAIDIQTAELVKKM